MAELSSNINSSGDASPAVTWITDDGALDQACQYWLTLNAIGVDTEFVRTRTYFARLGLIQIGAAGQCWLIDPLKITRWEPFGEVLTSPSLRKIIHSGSEDIEIFQRLSDQPLAGFFDTQIAAALCGMGPSLSYQALVLEMCQTEIEKDVTRSDWTARPLSPAQVRYAALDVAHLDELETKLQSRISELGRDAWLTGDCANLMARTTVEQHLATQYQRFKQVWKLSGPQRSALVELLKWRELTARQDDRPRSHILTDNDLLTLARELPEDREALMALSLEHSRSVSRRGTQLLKCLAAAATHDEHPQAQPEPLDRSARTVVSQLRGRVADKAQELGLAPEILCGKRDLLHLLQQGQPSRKLTGWRFELLKPLFADHLPT